MDLVYRCSSNCESQEVRERGDWNKEIKKRTVNYSDSPVMAAPALFIVSPNLSAIGLFPSSLSKLLKHCIVTNMSSIPVQEHLRSFITVTVGPLTYPKEEEGNHVMQRTVRESEY